MLTAYMVANPGLQGVYLDSTDRLVLPKGLAFPDGTTQDTAGGGGGGSAPTGHVLDSDTIALWRFGPDDPGKDETGNYTLTDYGTADAPTPVGRGRLISATTTFLRSAALSSRAIDWTGALTLEMLIYVAYGAATNSRIFSVDASGESESTNGLLLFGPKVNWTADAFWEYASGSNVDFLSALSLIPPGRFIHAALVRGWDDGGATLTAEFYLNGIGYERASGLTPPSGGEDSQISIGMTISNTQAGAFVGIIGDTRVSTIARTASEILASAKACGCA